MSTWDAVRGILWPRSAPVPDRRLKVTRTNGAALKGGWIMPDPWAGYWGAGIALTEGRSATYAQMYERQPWVYAIVNKLARGIGRLPLKAYGTDEKGGRFRLRNAPLATLLTAPYERGTQTNFMQRIVGDLAIYGNAMAIIGRKRPTQPATFLQPVHPQGWRIADDETYRRQPPGGPEEVYEPWQVYHPRFWRPGDDLGWGLSPMEPLRQTLLVEDAAQHLASSFFEKGAMPGLSIEAAPGTPMLTPDQIALVRAQVDMLHSGPSNAGKALILGGLKANPINVDFGAAALIDHRKLTREEVCAALDIPPPVVGILDHATFSNITEQARWLVQHTYSPWTTLIEETFAAQVLRGVSAYEGQFVEFEFAEVLRGDLPSRYEAYSRALTAGWLTQNEVRRLENYPAIQDVDADQLHRPMNLTPSMEPAAASEQLTPAKGYSPNGHANGHVADESLTIVGGQ